MSMQLNHLHLHFLNDLKVHVHYFRHRSDQKSFLFLLKKRGATIFLLFNTYMHNLSESCRLPSIDFWAFIVILDTY